MNEIVAKTTGKQDRDIVDVNVEDEDDDEDEGEDEDGDDWWESDAASSTGSYYSDNDR